MSAEVPTIRRGLIFGLSLSLAVHAAAAIALSFARTAPNSLAALTPNRPDDKKLPLKLGIDRSHAITVNWVGFEKPTEHHADPSTVEQAAVTPAPGVSIAAAENVPTPDLDQPQADPHQPEPDSNPKPEVADTPEPVAQMVPQPSPIHAKASKPLAELQAPAAVNYALIHPPAQPPLAMRTTPVPDPPKADPPKAAPRSAPAGSPGIKDRREAPAASISQALDHFGKPLAAAGLEIDTVRPRFSITIRAIARPANPVVQIHFNRLGKVAEAHFVVQDGRLMNTGHPDVDGPLMDAIYRWTARGKQLESLADDQTVIIEMRILLNG